MFFLTHLQCTSCARQFDPSQLHNLCPCGSPLFARYDLSKVAKNLSLQTLLSRNKTLWRYRELLPVTSEEHILSLGEGSTPLVKIDRLGQALGLENLYLKDESFNPTGSFKARGMAVAVSKAKELGVRKICLPSAGNAGSAVACYSAQAGIDAHIFMPGDVEEIYKQECRSFGVSLTLTGKSILEAAKAMNAQKENDWFDISTLKEPYRVEGKKTMGYEIAEELNWTLPRHIIYPTGGGTGLIGMWKAFDEMQELSWIDASRPKMHVVQAQGCAPIVKAFRQKNTRAEEWQNPETIASGIKVPKALADFLILKIVRDSKGEAISVSETEIVSAYKMAARTAGIMLCPEGAAALAALKMLLQKGMIQPQEKTLFFNTGSALKCPRFLQLCTS